MTIYTKKHLPSHIYRKIYEQHYGPIPEDSDGRTYEIHHIDGNSENNNPSNLVALSIQEHYAVHYSQGDYGACWMMSDRMKLLPEEISELASKNNTKRVSAGTHNLQKRADGTSISSDKVKNGTHHWLKRPDGSSESRNIQQRLVESGKHHFQKTGAEHPKYDHTIYRLQHINTSEIVSGTKKELIDKLGLTDANMSKLTRQWNKTQKGWKMYS